jgi:hypothetical protein
MPTYKYPRIVNIIQLAQNVRGRQHIIHFIEKQSESTRLAVFSTQYWCHNNEACIQKRLRHCEVTTVEGKSAMDEEHRWHLRLAIFR